MNIKDKIQNNMKAFITVIAILIVSIAGVGAIGTSPQLQEQLGETVGIDIAPTGETEVIDPNPVSTPDGGTKVTTPQADEPQVTTPDEPTVTYVTCPRCTGSGHLTTVIDQCSGEVVKVLLPGQTYGTHCNHPWINPSTGAHMNGKPYLYGTQTCGLCGGSGQVEG